MSSLPSLVPVVMIPDARAPRLSVTAPSLEKARRDDAERDPSKPWSQRVTKSDNRLKDRHLLTLFLWHFTQSQGAALLRDRPGSPGRALGLRGRGLDTAD